MVYIDDARNNFGRMKMCHMIADTHEELISMAQKIGVNIKWIQKQGKYDEHFDVCISKRNKAIEFGAILVDARKIVEVTRRKRFELHKEK